MKYFFAFSFVKKFQWIYATTLGKPRDDKRQHDLFQSFFQWILLFMNLKTPLLKDYISINIKDNLQDLPRDTLFLIADYLNPVDLNRVNVVSPYFKSVMSEDILYKKVLKCDHVEFKRAYQLEGSFSQVFKNKPHLRKEKFQSMFFPKKIARAIDDGMLCPKKASALNSDEIKIIDEYYSANYCTNFVCLFTNIVMASICIYSTINIILENDESKRDLPKEIVFIPIIYGAFSVFASCFRVYIIIKNVVHNKNCEALPFSLS